MCVCVRERERVSVCVCVCSMCGGNTTHDPFDADTIRAPTPSSGRGSESVGRSARLGRSERVGGSEQVERSGRVGQTGWDAEASRKGRPAMVKAEGEVVEEACVVSVEGRQRPLY